MISLEYPHCKTCLQPQAVLINEGGLLFCEQCFVNYRQLMDWMQGKFMPNAEDVRLQFQNLAKLKERVFNDSRRQG